MPSKRILSQSVIV